jgi:hypothetical protein
MDRQLVIRPHGDNFHVAFHNYMGPYEGHQIGETLGLEEVEAPEEDLGAEPLQLGQYYLWHAMDRHPDLHALVAPEQLGDVARAIDEFHVRVLKGKRFLPEREERGAKVMAEPPPSYIEHIEEEHKPVWCKGPRAMIQAVVTGAIPTAVILVTVLLLFRHFGDHRQEVGLDEVFRRANAPAAQQTALQNFWSPDHSGELSTRLTAVAYIEGDMVVLQDGHVLQFAGLRQARPVFEKARIAGVAPRLDIDLVGRRAIVRGIHIAHETLGAGTELKRLARLPRTAEVPQRTQRAGASGWYMPSRLPLGDTPEMRALVGQRLCLRGTLHQKGGGLELHCGGGEIFDVELARKGSSIQKFLDFFADGETDLRLDVVVSEVYRTRKQEETGVVGKIKLHSASAQNYHIVASR